MKTLISTDRVISLLNEHWRTPSSISCILEKASGRILMESILLDRDAPPYDRVMMDGYAISYKDWENGVRRYFVEGSQYAGESQKFLNQGEAKCIEIMTGAVCPQNSDCIIPVEYTSLENGVVQVDDTFPAEKNLFIHSKASDFKAGSVLLEKGKRLGPCEIAVAASCGYAELKVEQFPRIAVFSSGDELVPVTEKPKDYQIRQSNAWAIHAAIKNSGHRAKSLKHLKDDEALIEYELKEALQEHDILLLSGGVSKGKKDFFPSILNTLACQCIFHGVAQRPGKPMGFWKGPAGQVIVALPGNPVSVLTCLHRYVLPQLNRGKRNLPKIKLSEDYSSNGKLTEYLPVRIDEEGFATIVKVENSGDFISLCQSDGFMEFPAGQSLFSKGDYLNFFSWT